MLEEILSWINPILLYKFRTALTCQRFYNTLDRTNFLILQQVRWPELVPPMIPGINTTKFQRLTILRLSEPELVMTPQILNDRSWCRYNQDIMVYSPINAARNLSWLKTPDFTDGQLIDELRMYQAYPESHNHISHGPEPWLYARQLSPGIVAVVLGSSDLGSIVHEDKDRYDPYLTEILDILTKHVTVAQVQPITQYWVKLTCERPFCPTQWFSPLSQPYRTTVCNSETIQEIKRWIVSKYTVPIGMFRIIHSHQPNGTYLTQRVPFSVADLKAEIDIIRRMAVAPV